MNEVVWKIDKLIRGWEMEYGITNQTMVDARNEIIRLESDLNVAVESLRVAAEQIEMMKAQLIIRRDRITSLRAGPGGIMEMKQTIADKEKRIEELENGIMEKK